MRKFFGKGELVGDHGPAGPIVIAGSVVHETLRAELDDVVERMVARHRRELADYRRLPTEEIQNDVTSISRQAVALYVEWLKDGRDPTGDELARFGASAGRRAEEGFPLESVLSAYIMGFEGIFTRLTERAEPDDLPDVVALAGRIFDFVRHAGGAITKGYLAAFRAKVSQESNSRHAILDALLRDVALDEITRAAEIVLAPTYVLLNLALGEHPDVREEGVSRRIVARRMIRRLLAAFDAVADEGVLTSLNAAGGLVLIPSDAAVRWSKWSDVIASASQAAGVSVTAAATVTSPPRIRAAATETGEVLDVLRWFDKAPGMYLLDDVLVEYQLTRPGVARERLAALLKPIEDQSSLMDTLVCYMGNELNRRRTAAVLNVHPNTVDYRLRRIADLTGLDATHPAGIHRVAAALAARRAETTARQRDSLH